MSVDRGLATAAQAAAEPGPGSGEGGQSQWRSDGAGARCTLTPAGEEYVREWASKGYTDVHVPANMRCYAEQGRSISEIFFEERVHRIFDSLERTLLRKHEDYGPGNIAEAPGGALNGLRVRIHDKVARINNLMDGEKAPRYESLEDSFLDLANYAVIAILVLRKQWPGAK